MLLKTIVFDWNNPNWVQNKSYNHEFLYIAEKHLDSCIRHRGYVYLNQVCEYLGAGWDPDDENPCIRNDGIDRPMFIQFELFDRPHESYLIHIHSYD